MACGKPVVVTPSGGMVESVVANETGFFVEKRDARELANKVIELLASPKLAAEMGQKGRQRAVEVFSLDRMTRDTVAVYERAIQHQKTRAASPEKGSDKTGREK